MHELKPIDVDQIILGHPEIYFGASGPSGELIASRLAMQALVLGARKVSTERDGQWFIVAANLDWLTCGKHSPKEEGKIWKTMPPFVEAGPNNCRYEIMVRLYSEFAVTLAKGEHYIIVGPGQLVEESKRFCSAYSNWERVVVFKFSA